MFVQGACTIINRHCLVRKLASLCPQCHHTTSHKARGFVIVHWRGEQILDEAACTTATSIQTSQLYTCGMYVSVHANSLHHTHMCVTHTHTHCTNEPLRVVNEASSQNVLCRLVPIHRQITHASKGGRGERVVCLAHTYAHPHKSRTLC